ncbi:MAG: VCBS repeat-containing protein [Planctomycetales bacterium]|nr:VCBS repeat-containing protein [Planctomycetales bacterium]
MMQSKRKLISEKLEHRCVLTNLGLSFEGPLLPADAVPSRELKLVDINRDGHLDVVIANGTLLQTHLNGGDGTFGASNLIYDRGHLIDSLLANDVDLDGDVDFVISRSDVDSATVRVVEWLEATVDGDYIPHQLDRIFGSSSGPADVEISFADFDGDDADDVIIRCSQWMPSGVTRFSSLAVARGTGTGFDSPVDIHLQQELETPYDLVPLDVDGDGDQDVIEVPQNFGPMRLGLNAGQIDVPLESTELGPYFNTRLFVIDMNGDGRKEIMVSNGSWSDISTGRLDWQHRYLGPQQVVAIYDVDGDGRDDVVTFDANDEFWWYSAAGYRNGDSPMPFPGRFEAFDLGDVDSDGDNDVVASIPTANGISLGTYFNQGAGFGSFVASANAYYGPAVVVNRPMENHTTVAVATADSLNFMTIYEEQIVVSQALAAPGTVVQVLSYDVNRDGREDVLAVTWERLNVTASVYRLLWFAQNESGDFSESEILLENRGRYSFLFAQFADLQQDGIDDLVVTLKSSSLGSVVRSYFVGPEARLLDKVQLGESTNLAEHAYDDLPQFHDIDSDGDLDMILGEAIHTNAAGEFSLLGYVAIESPIAFIDLDEDGRTEIIGWNYYSEDSVRKLEVARINSFSPLHTEVTDSILFDATLWYPTVITTTDLDQDGDSDIFISTDGWQGWVENRNGRWALPSPIANDR